MTPQGHKHSVTLFRTQHPLTQNVPFLPVGSAPDGLSLSWLLSEKEKSGKLRYRSGTKPTSPCWFRACSPAMRTDNGFASVVHSPGPPSSTQASSLPGWVLVGHSKILPIVPTSQSQSPGSIPTLTHSSASPSSMTSSHSPSVIVSSSSRPAWAPQGKVQDLVVPHPCPSEVPTLIHT